MATKSLLSESIAKVEGVSTEIAPIVEQVAPPYVGYFEKTSGKMAELAQAGIQQGESYLAKDGKFFKAYPLKYHILQAKQLWTITDDAANVLEVSLEPQSYKSKFQEHYEVVLLVYTEGGLVPATSRLRGTKANAAKVPVREVQLAAKPDWVKTSPAHKLAAVWPEPWARFTATTTTQKRTAKTTGRPFYLANTTVAPVSATDNEQLKAFFEDSNNKKLLADVFSVYNSKVADLLGKVVK